MVIYRFLLFVFQSILRLLGVISAKLKQFREVRKGLFQKLCEDLDPNKPVIWFHCASLGEYEQGFPVMRQLKDQFTDHQLLVSFFSPSGYEVKQNDPFIDVITYLPIDTAKNARQFIQISQPQLAVFVKYEIWPNFIKTLHQQQVPAYLISALFNKEQVFFQPYGKWMRAYLKRFDLIFVQDRSSYQLAKKMGLHQLKISGDTRYDRVYYQTQLPNDLTFMDDFVQGQFCLVIGSSWPEDEQVFMDYVDQAEHKVVIAPHQVKSQAISDLTSRLTKSYALYSTWDKAQDADKPILIVDTVGLLTKVYAYADLAYIGGGMGDKGLHNILEPAAFGLPVIFGKNHKGFPEAEALIKANAGFSIASAERFYQLAEEFYQDKNKRSNAGKNALDLINARKGATKMICKDLAENLSTY